jgi:serine beta-lactamase-like protein LACTB
MGAPGPEPWTLDPGPATHSNLTRSSPHAEDSGGPNRDTASTVTAASKKTWKDTWATPILLAVVLPVVAMAGFVAYINFAATTLHPNPLEVKSVMDADPLPGWAEEAEKARQIARDEISRQNVPGMSVAVGVGDKIVWAEGFGWADLKSKTPVDPRSAFRIGHVSKALTSAAVGVLLERGSLHLGENIQAYVPAYPTKQWPVTLRELMGHMAGVRHYRDTEWGDKPTAQCNHASEGLKSFATEPLLFEPGKNYRYSTYGWVLVSAAVEAAASEPFFRFMQDEVFTPLGMADSAPESAAEAMPNRVTSYFRRLEREQTSDVNYSCFAGGGAFFSTPSDLLRFSMGLGAGKLLKPTTVSMLQSAQQLTSGEDTSYGLGWMLDTVTLAGEPTRQVGHSSRTIEGASTSLVTFPDRGLFVAVTMNISFADPRWTALAIAEAFDENRRKR